MAAGADRGCPGCGGGRTERYGSAFARGLRWLAGKRAKWRCQDCGARFRVGREHLYTRVSVLGALLVLFTVGALEFVSGAGTFGEYVKRNVIGAYRSVYGSEHRSKLKEDWTWLYGDSRSARKEYRRHQ